MPETVHGAPPFEAAVRALYERLLDAWNRRDAQGFGALFTPDAAMIGFDGSQARGAEVEAHLAPVFADHPTAPYVAKVRQVRRLGAGVVLLEAIVGMVPPGQTRLNPAVNAVQSLVAVTEPGSGAGAGAGPEAWRIALFQTTPAAHHGRPDLVDRHTAELRQVLGEPRR